MTINLKNVANLVGALAIVGALALVVYTPFGMFGMRLSGDFWGVLKGALYMAFPFFF